MYDLIALNGVPETQTQTQKISGQNVENVHLLFWRLNWSSRKWFLLHLASFKAPSAHRSFSQRLWGRRLSGQVARLDSLVVRADSVGCSASCWYQLPQLAAAQTDWATLNVVHPITFHVLVLLLLFFIIIILFLDVFNISTCLSKTADDRVKVLLHLIYLFNDDVFTFVFVCLL